jgi:hypothetical protein
MLSAKTKEYLEYRYIATIAGLIAHFMNSQEISFRFAAAGIWSPWTADCGKCPLGPPGGSAEATRSATQLFFASPAVPTHASASIHIAPRPCCMAKRESSSVKFAAPGTAKSLHSSPNLFLLSEIDAQ